jgi:hypothetical protein
MGAMDRPWSTPGMDKNTFKAPKPTFPAPQISSSWQSWSGQPPQTPSFQSCGRAWREGEPIGCDRGLSPRGGDRSWVRRQQRQLASRQTGPLRPPGRGHVRARLRHRALGGAWSGAQETSDAAYVLMFWSDGLSLGEAAGLRRFGRHSFGTALGPRLLRVRAQGPALPGCGVEREWVLQWQLLPPLRAPGRALKMLGRKPQASVSEGSVCATVTGSCSCPHSWRPKLETSEWGCYRPGWRPHWLERHSAWEERLEWVQTCFQDLMTLSLRGGKAPVNAMSIHC